MTRVVFVCQHGAAKSVLAAHELERLARERGLDVHASALGVEPDEIVAPGVLAARPDLEGELRAFRPVAATAEALAAAGHIVLIGIEPSAVPLPVRDGRSAVERWDDVPAVSDDPEAACLAIDRRLEALLDALAAR